jgi:hypothetical protein
MPIHTQLPATEKAEQISQSFHPRIMVMKIEIDKDVGTTATKRDLILPGIVLLFVIAMGGTLATSVNMGIRGKEIDVRSTDPASSRSSRRLTECPVNIKMTCHGCELESVEIDSSRAHQAPNKVGMLFRGGSCEENVYTTQAKEPLSCIDYGEGPPKQGSNETVYIRVLDETNSEVTFEGTVREGSVYNVSSSKNDGPLGSKMHIVIFADSTLQTPLQSATFEVTCTDEPTNSLLFNVFGSSQIVTIGNEHAQETVALTLDVTIGVELSSTGSSAIILQELYVRNSLATEPLLNGTVAGLTDIVVGGSSGVDDQIEVSFRLPFPARGESSIDTIVTGVGVTEDGELCRFAGFKSFPIIL